MKYQLTFALVASLTGTAFAEFKAPLPEFKNEKQLAEWRAEKASEATRQGYATEETAFYTGKPYLASSCGYAFKYRSYSPEVVRWTSGDPSGFPDGANQNRYAPNPTSEIDFMGLVAWKIRVTGSGSNDLTPSMVWRSDGVIGAQATLHVLGGGGIPADPVSSVTIGGRSQAGYDPSYGATYYSGLASLEATITATSDGKLKVTPGAGNPENGNGSLKVGGNLNFIFDDENTKKSGSIQMLSMAAYNPSQLTGIGFTIKGTGLNATWTNGAQPTMRAFSGSLSFEVVE